jgi:hypothetical protein
MHQIITRVWYELISLWYEAYVGVSIFLDNPNSKSLATPFFLPCKSHCGVLNKLTLLKPKKVSL